MVVGLLTLVYTFEGGMAAVIWTDVVQMAIYVGGTIVALWSLVGSSTAQTAIARHRTSPAAPLGRS